MNDIHIPICFSRAIRSPVLRAGFFGSLIAWVGVAPAVHAQTVVTWANNGTDFTSGANWSGGVAPANDTTTNIAAFGTSTSVQPALTGNRSVAGLTFYDFGINTLSGGFNLTIGAAGITNSGTSGAKTVTITGSIALAANQTFSNAGSLLIQGTGLNLGSHTLSLDGTGTSGRIDTLIYGTGGITKIGSGTWEIDASISNQYTGPTQVDAGKLVLVGGAAYLSTVTVASGATVRPTSEVASFAEVGALAGAGTVELGSALFAAGRNNASTTFSGNTTGSAFMYKLGSGTLTLTGDTSSVSLLTVNAGTVQLGAGGASGTYPAVIENGATLTFNHSDTLTYGGSIEGSGSVVKTGSGTLKLTGTIKYTGSVESVLAPPVLVSAGTLSIGDGGTAGTVIGSITNNASVVFNRSDSTSFAYPISGTGNVKVTGGGNLTLSGANSYTGTTEVFGELSVLAITGAGNYAGDFIVNGDGLGAYLTFEAGHTGSVTGDIAITSGRAIFRPSGTTTYGGIVSGSVGALVADGTGTLVLTADHSFTGTTRVSTGTLSLGNGGTTGSVAGPIFTAANLVINRSDDLTFTNFVEGPGSFTKLGTNTVTLGTTLTHTGATIISAGTLANGTVHRLPSTAKLEVGASGTFALSGYDQTIHSLAGAGNITLGAGYLTVAGDGTSTTFSGSLTGNGGLIKTGTGTLTLTGSNNHAGGTTLAGGTLALSSDAALGQSGSFLTLFGGTLRSTATLTLNRTTFLDGNNTIDVTTGTRLTYSGSLIASDPMNPPSITKTGAGTLLLTQNTGYDGALIVAAGTVAGTGVAGPLTLAGGTLSPGSSPGTFTAGDTTFGPGGAFLWETNDATGTVGVATDLLSITGTLTITATSAQPFTVSLASLLADNSGGDVMNFNPLANHTFTFATATGGITGFSSDAFSLTTTSFTNDLASGTWAVEQAGNDLTLVFSASSAIPEPSTYAALTGLGALAVAAIRRRRTACHRTARR